MRRGKMVWDKNGKGRGVNVSTGGVATETKKRLQKE